MGLPTQVMAQEKEADRLQLSMVEKPESKDGQESIENGDNLEEGTLEEETLEEEALEDPPETKEEALDSDGEYVEEKGADYWKHRFKVMEGKHKSEVPVLMEQNRELQAQITNLQNLIANTANTESQVTEEVKPTFLPDQYVTKEEKEELEQEGFDEKTVNLITKMAHRMVEAEFAEPLNSKVDKLTGDVAVSSEDRFKANLSAAVSDWETVNTDPEFLEWLSHEDGYSGVTRHQSLIGAHSNKNLARVVSIFNDFKEAMGRTQAPEPTNKLKKQIVPARSSVSSPPVESEEIWTKAKISNFYAEQIAAERDNSWTEDDRKRFNKRERDLFKAQKEGRIQP